MRFVCSRIDESVELSNQFNQMINPETGRFFRTITFCCSSSDHFLATASSIILLYIHLSIWKELKVIDFYCKKCKKSMKVSYMVTGNRNYPVLPRVMMKCHHCGRVMTLKNFKEGELLDKVEQDKYYI